MGVCIFCYYRQAHPEAHYGNERFYGGGRWRLEGWTKAWFAPEYAPEAQGDQEPFDSRRPWGSEDKDWFWGEGGVWEEDSNLATIHDMSKI